MRHLSLKDGEKYHFECQCTSMEHDMVVQFDSEDEVVYVHTQLAQHRNFFQRAWLALKYIFGHRSKYGHWEETMLDLKKAEELEKMLLRFKVKCKTGEDR